MISASEHLLNYMHARGYTTTVQHGEAVKSTDTAAILEEVRQMEEAKVIFHRESDGARGWALLYTNEPGACEPDETVVDFLMSDDLQAASLDYDACTHEHYRALAAGALRDASELIATPNYRGEEYARKQIENARAYMRRAGLSL